MLTLILGALLGFLIYYKIIKPMNLWADMGITHEPAWPIVGNMGDMVFGKKHMFDTMRGICRKYPDDRYIGFFQFTTPTLLIQDPDLMKQVCVKDFDNFRDRNNFEGIDSLTLSKSLLSLNGDEWKQMRATLSPAFTSSKMKNMYILMVECAQNFCKNLQNKRQMNLEMKDVFSRFANDVIASTAFGIQIDSVKERNNEFYQNGQKLTNFSTAQMFKFFAYVAAPRLAKFLKLSIIDPSIELFFKNIFLNNIKEREEKKIIRHDLIHLLIEAQKGTLKHEETQEQKEGFATVKESHIGQSTNKMVLTDDHLVAQAIIFFFAGFETVSTLSSLMAYELAINPDVQKKLQQEIDAVSQKFPNEVPYETLMSMKYLDQVVSESLRKWPFAVIDRRCTKNFEVLPTNAKETKVLIKNGIVVGLPVVGMHYNPKYYPDPERFDPERFNDENKHKIVSGTYMPFGLGPRNCIGSRFALLEVKTVYFYLLSQFDIVPNDKTQIPLILAPRQVNVVVKNGIQLGLKPRK